MSQPLNQNAERIDIRACEIRAGALELNADHGNAGARSEARKLRYALRLKAETPTTSIDTFLDIAGVDKAALRIHVPR